MPNVNKVVIGRGARLDFLGSLDDGSVIDLDGAQIIVVVKQVPGGPDPGVIVLRNALAGGSDLTVPTTDLATAAFTGVLSPADTALLKDGVTYHFDASVLEADGTDWVVGLGSTFLAVRAASAGEDFGT